MPRPLTPPGFPPLAPDQAPLALPRRERVLARRAIGRASAIVREALAGVQRSTGETRARLLEAATAGLAAEIEYRLRRNRRIDEAPFPILLRRLAARLGAFRRAVPRAGDEYYRILRLEAEVVALAGDAGGAADRLEAAAGQLALVQDYLLRDELLQRLIELALPLGRADAVARPVLRDLAGRRQNRRLDIPWFDSLAELASVGGQLRTPALRAGVRKLRIVAWLSTARPRLVGLILASMWLNRIARPAIRRTLARERPVADAPPTVVRAMGGAGDMLMMTPGLRALAARGGGPVRLRIPARFAALFEANPDVVLEPIEALDESWRPPPGAIDLTDCPAVAGELLELPKIVTNRIELFAAGMGVSEGELDRYGSRPVFEPAPRAVEAARAWLAARGIPSGGFIAIQAEPAERYRSWPRMAEAATRLAELIPVVAVHDRALDGYDVPAVHPAFGLDFATSLALACEARLILAPDSAFLHLAGARAIPSVGIFGPTGGKVRVAAYPEARVVALAERLGCIPCWRNELIPCRLTGGLRSLCLDALETERVVAAVRDALGLS